jgi:pullulanase/glycogen debranching enzyme
MDSLRYWVTEMHVDGFRFDLAATLARQFHEVDRLSAFFDLVQQDPVVSQVKLIAEPWDVGDGGYQVGNFPPLWVEWNGRYRDAVRDFWRGEPAAVAEFASRLTGSSDLYQSDGRRPIASVNFVTAHDGFTLRDLVSYNDKHNEANNQANHDGTDDNRQAQDTGLLEFPRRLIALRQAHPVFRRNRFLAGADARDLRWFTPAGTELTDATWSDPNALAVPLYLDGCDVPDRAAGGTWLIDDNFASGDPIAESPVEGDDSCGRNTSAWRPEEADHESPRSTGAWLDGSSAAPAVPHRGRRAGGLHRPVRIDLLLLRR